MLTEKIVNDKLNDWFVSDYQYKIVESTDEAYLVTVVGEKENGLLYISVCRIFESPTGRAIFCIDYDETIPKDNKSLLASCITGAMKQYANHILWNRKRR
jgi:hypothetical protein